MNIGLIVRTGVDDEAEDRSLSRGAVIVATLDAFWPAPQEEQ